MKYHLLLIPLLACSVSLIFLSKVLYDRRYKHITTPAQPNDPQCAHWAAFRAAQLFGIPTEAGDIQRLLPNEPQGHSLVQVVETLGKIGIKAEGFRDNWDSLAKFAILHIHRLTHSETRVILLSQLNFIPLLWKTKTF